MRTAGWVIGTAAIAVTVVVGWMVAIDWREMRKLDASIVMEQAVVDSLKVERKAVDARMREVSEEVKTLPQEARLARGTRAAHGFAKQQELVEGRITRSQTRIRNFEGAKDGRARHMGLWAAMGGVGWVLIVTSVVIQRGRRGRDPRKRPVEAHKP